MDDPPLITFIANQNGLADHLLAEHVATAGGDCAACPGPQSGRRRWPCDTHLAARAAKRQHDPAPGP